MRAAVYTRVSSEEQVGGTSLGNQLERAKAHCTAQGWDVVEVFTDEGVSGAKDSRPALDQLMQAVRGGQVDAVVVYKTDRFSRSRSHLFQVLEELAKLGVAFTSVTEGFDTSTTHGDAMVGMLGVFAQMERSVIAERTSTGKRRRIREGGWGGGDHSPYGYVVVGEGRDAHLEVDEAEAAMLRRAVALLLDQGLTTMGAAQALNAEGYLPRKAARWSATNLRNALVRAQLDGQWTWGKGTKGGAITVPVPPIMDSERFAMLQAYLHRTTTSHSKTGKVYPLSGRIVGTCGHPFHGIGRADRTLVRYRCRWGRDTPHHDRCPEPTVRAEAVEAEVWEQVRGLLADPELLMAQASDHLGLLDGAAGVERDALVRAQLQVERLQQALTDATTSALKAAVDAETLRQVTAQLQQELAQARDHVRMVAAMRSQTEANASRVVQVRKLAAIAQERLAGADKALQQRVLDLLDVKVTILSHGRPGSRAGVGGPVALRVEGCVLHGMLLASAESDWHPRILASAPR